MTFEDRIDEDFGDLVQRIGAWAKRTASRQANKFLADLGSAKAEGRLDLQTTTEILMRNWKYFSSSQQVQPSLMAVTDFIRTTLGWKMSEDSVFKAIYGNDPQVENPNAVTQNSPELKKIFLALAADRVPERRLYNVATRVAQIAKSNEQDEALVIKWMTVLANKNPAILKKRELAPISVYAHGGILDDRQVRTFMTEVAKILIRQSLGGTSPSAASSTPVSQTNTPVGQKTPPTGQVVAPNNTNKAAPQPIKTVSQIKQQLGKYNKTIAEAEQRAAGNDNFVNQFRINKGDTDMVNGISAIYFQYFAKVNVAALTQYLHPLSFLSPGVISSAVALIKASGDPNEIKIELDQITGSDLKKASAILAYLIKFKTDYMRSSKPQTQTA